MNKQQFIGVLLLGCAVSVSTVEAAIHAKVQQALDWELPALECTKPKIRGAGIAITDGSGDRTQTDVDSYTLARNERKMKRWNTCVSNYKQRLNTDFETLKDCAQYGLTKDQANIILGKMKLIQTTIISLQD